MTVAAPPSAPCETVQVIAADTSSSDLEADRVSVGVLVLPGRCWRCRQVTYPIVGVLGPGGAFRPFAEVAEQLAATLPESTLREIGTGPIQQRRSRVGSYLSNGCVHCDAIQGEFPLREDLAAFRAEGGTLADLLVGEVCLPRTATT